ncbi:hypothetical protein HZH68_012204 [Vespula germanica]|uniref:Uncharacterized protein n=1 Tax=Vespula germanica TaxID=30212 RepID=A0A834MX01_VESGE|nr:hypothetical protein HZH68_012204 [Vespula germanica]
MNETEESGKVRRKKKNAVLTFAATVWTTEDGALLYCAKGSKQLSYIVFGLLFAQHSHEQLSVCGSLAECRKRQREDLAANTENDKVTRLHQHPPS